MQRLFALAAVAALALTIGAARAEDKEAKPKDIGEIMKKAHAGAKALRAAVAKAVKAKEFDKAEAPMKAWAALAPHLGSFDPPKGEKDSWKKLSEEYAKDVKSLADAVKEKDEKAANAALMKIGKGCKACHDAHQKE